MLKLENICKKYGKKSALEDINIVFCEGVYAILGPNGSGKTTLLNIICGNLEQNSGTILWNDSDINVLDNCYRSILGYVPQTLAVYPGLTAEEYLTYISLLKNIPIEFISDEIARVLSYVDLSDVRQAKVCTFSEGMKRRLLISQAFLGDPKIIILDEPTAGLDPGQRIHLKKILRDFSQRKVILYATHIVSDVEGIADQYVFLKCGKILSVLDKTQIKAADESFSELEKRYMEIYDEKLFENDFHRDQKNNQY